MEDVEMDKGISFSDFKLCALLVDEDDEEEEVDDSSSLSDNVIRALLHERSLISISEII